MNGFSFWLQPLPAKAADRGGDQHQDAAGDQGIGGEAEPAPNQAAHPKDARANAGNQGPDVGWDTLVAHMREQS
jgi:hypothetical protein